VKKCLHNSRLIKIFTLITVSP